MSQSALALRYHIAWVFLNSGHSEDRTEFVTASRNEAVGQVVRLLADERTKSVAIDVLEYIA